MQTEDEQYQAAIEKLRHGPVPLFDSDTQPLIFFVLISDQVAEDYLDINDGRMYVRLKEMVR